MGSIRSSIELQDNFTSVLMNVINAVNMSVSTIEQMQSTISGSIDTSAIQGIRDQMNQATIAAQQLDAVMQNMSEPQMQQPPAPNWVNQSTIQVSTNTGIERLTDEMDSLNQMSGEVFRSQQRINDQALNMDILPRNASWDINDISQRITALSQHLQNLQGYDANLLGNDGAEQISRQYETIRTNMNSIINLQAQLDQAIQEGDVSGLNQGYNQLNQMIVQVEQQARSTQQVLNSLTNIEWHFSGVEVFTGSGIERFQQEVQSANDMLNTLGSTQALIASRAAQANIFPPNMVADMNGMQNRIQAIQTRIQAIEGNPMNLGTDTANAELEQLRSQLHQAVQEQEAMNRAVQNMDIQAANQAYLHLSQIVGGTERHIRDNVDEQGRFNRRVEQGTHKTNELKRMIGGVITAYATIQTVSNALSLSDTFASTTARLNMMNDGLQTTQELQDRIFLSAQWSRGLYQETADAVSKLGLMAGDAFDSSQEIVAFMEQVNKQFRIAGTEAAGIDAAMLQLTQAMGSGVLRGEEYNSILEQAPNIIQTIADYLEVPKGKLKDMAAEGKITADIVKAAMFAAADETNTKFESMPMTFEQIRSSLENIALMSLQPLLEKLNEVANSEAFKQLVDHAANAISMLVIVANPIIDQIVNSQVLWDFANEVINVFFLVGAVALKIFSLLMTGINLLADNWSWLSPIIYGVAAALAVYYGWLLLVKGVELASAAGKIAMTVAQNIYAAAIALTTGATMAQVAAQNGLNAAMYACPIVWIIVLIIILIAIIFAVCSAIAKMTGIANSGFGVIAGGINVVIQFFKNLGLSVANIALGIGNAIGALASNIMTAFHNAICSVQSWFYDLLSTGLSVIEGICKALNKLPFVEFDYSGVTSAADNYAAKAAEAAGNKEDYKSISDAFNNGFNTFDTFQDGWVSDAFNAGASWGDGIAEKISNFDPSSLFGTTNIPSADDYAGALTAGEIGSGIDDISGNTGAMADAMDITGEELKYLRDIAEQEVVNRFTTAEINIEQTNNNTISGKMDLDGIVSGLTDAMYEAVEISAEGVHI